eukprot:c11699_g1_i1.p2 GENE.c11699_g1_i1~~c11699_g1_i1.p2  ORF type:complete len:788 (+),score=194.93 c11699_g1_i1:34-2364(+)
MIRRKAPAFMLGMILLAMSAPLLCSLVAANEAADGTVHADLGAHSRKGTDSGAAKREAEAMSYDGFSVHERKMMEATTKNVAFQADVSRVMGILIGSLYSNKEVFLRELISNASDALDKIRYLSLTDKTQLGANDKLEMRIKVDSEAQTITLSDTGVGMTAEDLVSKLGKIAASGTKEFMDSMKAEDATSLIGQFGVGFYSVFLIADRVTVISKHNADDQHVWMSDASAEYSLAKDPRGNTLGRGTQIVMHLKEDALEYLDLATLRALIKKYSGFIAFPIYMWASKTVNEDGSPLPADGEVRDEEPEGVDASATTREVWEWELVNSAKPIWTRPKEDITEAEYNEFYRVLTGEEEDPLAYTHFIAEGEVSFSSILAIPKKAPQDLFSRYTTKRRNVKLYVRRVFITDDFDGLLPSYLSFVRGIVDSDNLPLNVSREMLQQNKMLKSIRKKLTRKVLDMIRKISKDDEELYNKFWAEYGTSIRLGLMEDTANRSKLAKLLRFQTSKSEGKLTSLEAYVERMPESQAKIYYLAGESVAAIEKSPYLELLKRKSIEVLYLSDPVDEYSVGSLPEYDGKKLANLAKDPVDMTEDEEKVKAIEEDFAELLVWLKVTLSTKIEKAAISRRLVESPCTLVSSHFGYTPNMQRVMKSQAMAGDNEQAYMLNAKKNLDLNPYHPLIKELNRRFKDDREDPVLAKTALMLFETASLNSGYGLEDPTDFVSRIHRLMMIDLDVAPDAEVQYEGFEAPPGEPAPAESGEATPPPPPEEEGDIDADREL